MNNHNTDSFEFNDRLVEFEEWCLETGESSVDKFIEVRKLSEKSANELRTVAGRWNRVDELLKQQESGGAPAIAAGRDVGKQIGPYQLVRILGEGGMGTVWLAQQTSPVRREVALKLVRTGNDSNVILKRFDTERQSLASLSHPNVARILDAGTTENDQPFFVMEYVDGESITDYCNENRLSLEERLELFLQLCAGIQHAHQRGVIHRDIKSSNVLVAHVDGKPQVKVIDFGLARSLEGENTNQANNDLSVKSGAGNSAKPNPRLTQFQTALGSPLWMSPEQARGRVSDERDTVDTRSDIFSLGVILYQLLTNSTPITEKFYHSASPSELLEAIHEQMPTYPSVRLSQMNDSKSWVVDKTSSSYANWTSMLSNDLDWVTMKAIEKEPARRYQDVAAFADDVRRFINCEPVTARPPSGVYRFKKLVRKHRAASVMAGCGLLLLAGSAIALTYTTLWALNERSTVVEQAKLILEEKKIAQEERDKAVEQSEIAQEALKRAQLAEEEARASREAALAESRKIKKVAKAFVSVIGERKVSKEKGKYSEADSRFLLRVHELLGDIEFADEKLNHDFHMALFTAIMNERSQDIPIESLIKTAKAAYGKEADKTVFILLELAFLRHNWNGMEESVALADECEQIIAKKGYAPTHQFSIGLAAVRAQHLITQGKADEVPELLESVVPDLLPRDKAKSLKGGSLISRGREALAEAYAIKGDYRKATKYSREAFEGFGRYMGKDHATQPYSEAVYVLYSAKLGECVKTPEEILEFAESTAGWLGDGQETIGTRQKLMEALFELKEYKSVIMLGEKQLPALEKIEGHNDIQGQMLQWVSKCHDELGDFESAFSSLKASTKAIQNHYGRRSPELAKNYLLRATLLHSNDRVEEARKAYERANGILNAISFDRIPMDNPTREFCREVQELVEDAE